ncbi:di-trans,poly-cis-decaprenylcistransferase [Oleiharenicola lentus]|uniref:Isoprenyl transferase n=1 Tax=Oleiharenicola lentus TaxID=2508720 RepID=A0A4Q1C9F4_9BACT|nr:polyprenyl diphosphate synthase [Oleiharenicola lentus]RXK55647.1 di-trans,poly-cis-decaprenylcistransferase [Oleiharenicola lentus]
MSSPSPGQIPQHVAIIMDGNGRWAKQRGLPRLEGHRRGVETVRTVVDAAREIGIRYITLYAFSVENWKRPPEEVSGLMGLLDYFLKRELNNLIKNRVRLLTIGRTHELPENVQRELNRVKEATKDFTEWTLVLALNYGSRTEVADAARDYAAAVQAGREKSGESSWESFSRYLYTGVADIPEPDLLIRTSGEQRISNFLMLQLAYAEMIFTPIAWPDFGKADLEAAVVEFNRRERRYGLTTEQLRTGPQ